MNRLSRIFRLKMNSGGADYIPFLRQFYAGHQRICTDLEMRLPLLREFGREKSAIRRVPVGALIDDVIRMPGACSRGEGGIEVWSLIYPHLAQSANKATRDMA